MVIVPKPLSPEPALACLQTSHWVPGACLQAVLLLRRGQESVLQMGVAAPRMSMCLQ